jgi:hypothetical protein
VVVDVSERKLVSARLAHKVDSPARGERKRGGAFASLKTGRKA